MSSSNSGNKASDVISKISLTSSMVKSGYGVQIHDKDWNQLTGDNLVGTGASLGLYESKWHLSGADVKVILYGDLNGDGRINASDALIVVKNKTGKEKITDEIYIEAGRITDNTRKNNATPTAADALAIVKAKLGKYTINQYRDLPINVNSYSDLYSAVEINNTNLIFSDSAKEIKDSYEKLKSIAAKYCKQDMNQQTKALILHDYLVANSKLNYKTTDCDANDKESNICNVGGTMNQLGFANAYNCLLSFAGIQSTVVRDKYANYRNNALNEVTIDGQIYYVCCGADSYIS